jgi:hypothetical protein
MREKRSFAMRAIILAAVVGLSSTFVLAGPSDHASRRPGDVSKTERADLSRDGHARRAPYALTGQREQRRVLEFRDVPKGRGQSERVAFWTWVTE